MKKLFIIVLLFVTAFLFSESFSFDSPAGSFKVSIEGSDSGNTNSVIDEIAKRVEFLQEKYNSKLNKLDQKRADKVIDQIYELLALLPEEVMISSNVESTQTQDSNVNISLEISGMQNTNDQQNEPKKPVLKEVKSAMSKSEFQELLSNVQNEGFADDQLSVIRISINSKYFSIDQLIQLINAFSFSDEKIQVVQLVYPKVVDKDNAHNLLSAFTYSDDKKKVENIINR